MPLGRGARVAAGALLAASFAWAQGDKAPFRETWNRSLPAWLSIEPQVRLRYEGRQGNAFEIHNAENALLTRYLLGVRIQPSEHVEFFVQGMDARMLGPRREVQNDRYRNIGELREAWVRIGRADGLVSVQAGRLIHQYGFQRVLAPANWSNSRRAFDAVKLSLGRPGARVDLFTGSEVNERMTQPDWPDYGNGLHGAYGVYEKVLPRAKVEPYLLYRTRRLVRPELGGSGDGDTITAGARISGEFGSGWDFDVEMSRQTGDLGGDSVSAWAGNWVLGRRFAQASWEPRVYAYYLFASGDADPTDGRRGTYDQLYPANHANRGAADLQGRRNVKNPTFGLDLVPAERWELRFEKHFFWLANRADAWYTFSGDARVARVDGGASSTRIGNQLDVVASYQLNSATEIGAGVGRFWRGGFLKRHSDIRSSTFPYLFVDWTP